MNKGLITGLPLFKRGKVRDIYDLGDRLLIVATDRISCFDVVLPTEKRKTNTQRLCSASLHPREDVLVTNTYKCT